MRLPLVLAALLAVLLISACTLSTPKKGQTRTAFAIDLFWDGTSSGASRFERIHLNFNDSRISGNRSYSVSDVAGNTFTCFYTINNTTWALESISLISGSDACIAHQETFLFRGEFQIPTREQALNILSNWTQCPSEKGPGRIHEPCYVLNTPK